MADALDLVPFKGAAKVPPAALISAEVGSVTDKARPADIPADPLISRLLNCFKSQVRHQPHTVRLGLSCKPACTHTRMQACTPSAPTDLHHWAAASGGV